MLENPEDYYQAFGESSSKSYSFPTEGNLDPPSPPLKRFHTAAAEEEEETSSNPSSAGAVATPSTASTPSTSASTSASSQKVLKRYVPEGYQEMTKKIPTTATSPSSTYEPPARTLKRFHQDDFDNTFASTPVSPTRIRFQSDDAGMMMEAPCVRIKPNQFVPLSMPTKQMRKAVFTQEISGGPMLDATPQTSVPQPKPLVPLKVENIIVDSTTETETARSTKSSSLSSSFVEGDAAGNLKLSQTADVPLPQPSPPLQQYKPLRFQTDSAGMMLEQDVVPKPKPIPPLTVDQIKVSNENEIMNKPTSSASTSSKYKLSQQATPPTDEQYYRAQTPAVADSGITGKPRQPTLLWEQRESDYIGGDST
jgi:hypothetical protein